MFTDAHSQLSLSSGLLFANPIPRDSELAKIDIDGIVVQAVSEAHAARITGKDNTPFILNRIRELTHGRSSTANIALVEWNVIRGTRIAVELAKLKQDGLHDLGE